MSKLVQPLKYHGGKHYLASKIVALMPRHLCYLEPFAGGLSVLLARNPADKNLEWKHDSAHRGVSEVVNDLNGHLINFWRVLKSDLTFPKFKRAVEAVPFAELEWKIAHQSLDDRAPTESEGNVDRAVDFFVCCRQSLAGRMQDFSGITKTRTRGGCNAECNAWLGAVEGLPAVHARLKNVLIIGPRPAVKVLHEYDLPQTLAYLDPPYLHDTRKTKTEYGKYEMSALRHGELLQRLASFKGKFMLSGYRSPLYDRHAEQNGWVRHDFAGVPNAAAGNPKPGTKKRLMTECVWCNF